MVLIAITVFEYLYISTRINYEAENRLISEVTGKIHSYIQDRDKWGTRESALDFTQKHDFYIRFESGLLNSERRTQQSEGNEHTPGLNPYFHLVDYNGNILSLYDGSPEVKENIIITRSYTSLKIDDEVVGYIRIFEIPSLAEEKSILLEPIIAAMKVGFLTTVLIALGIGIVSGKRITHPLRQLTDIADSLKDGLKGQQITNLDSRDEIGILARALNAMSLELEIKHTEVRNLAIRDGLTGLYNRRFFDEQIRVMISNAHRYNHYLTLVLGDVDHFKQVNDSFSHSIGDRVLKQISNIIQEGVREGDLAARYGGEEIVLVLSESDNAESLIIIERIRKQIESFNWGSIAVGLSVTMSFGLCAQNSPESYDLMIEEADKRLYDAKKMGRNRTSSS